MGDNSCQAGGHGSNGRQLWHQIGKGVIISVKAAVIEDIPDHATAVGVPARAIKRNT